MQKITLGLFSIFIALLIGNAIVSEAYRILLIIFLCGAMIAQRNVFYKNIELFLCVFIVINFNIFGLLPKFGEFYHFQETLLPIMVFYIFNLLLRNEFGFGRYGLWIIAYVIILIFGIIVASRWGQPLSLGMKAIKFHMLILVYFLVVNCKIDVDKFTKYYVILGIVLAILTAFQYILLDKFLFFNLDEEKLLEYGKGIRGIRVTTGASLISTAAVIAFAKYLKKHGNLYLYIFLGLFMHVVLISKTRMLIVGIIMTSIVLYLIYRKFSLKRVFLTIVVMVIFSIVVTKVSSLVENKYLETIKQDIEGEGTYRPRANAYDYYFNQFKKSPFVGYGYWNFVWKKNPEAQLQERGIHFSDIGITHLIIESGLVGAVWLFYGLIRFIPAILKGNRPLDAIAYIIFALMVIVTLDYFLGGNTIFLFGIFLGLIGKPLKENIPNTYIVST